MKRYVAAWTLLAALLAGCEKPLPEGGRITVTYPPQPVRSVTVEPLVLPWAAAPFWSGRDEIVDSALNGTLVQVKFGGVTGPITAAAWFCLNQSGSQPDLVTTYEGFLALERVIPDWAHDSEFGPSKSCQGEAINQQLDSLRAASPDHAVAVTGAGYAGMRLNYSRVTFSFPRTRRGEKLPDVLYSLTAGSYFCALKLGLAGTLRPLPAHNPRFGELQALWNDPPKGGWTCDPVRVREELLRFGGHRI